MFPLLYLRYNKGMYILCINMAVQPYSFAIVDEKTTIVSHVFWSSYTQSESMISLIKDTMTQQSLSFNQLHGVGVVVGPGQYTGIRMGVTMAKSIAMGLSIPIIGITTFEALLQPYLAHTGIYLACIPARKNEYNIQLFAINKNELSPLTTHFSIQASQLALFLNQFKSLIYVVSVIDMPHYNQIQPIKTHIDSSDSAQYVLRCIRDNKNEKVFPIYSHSPIKMSKRGR